MSTHDFLDDPSGGSDEKEIDAALDAVEFHHQHVAPLVRRCNRLLTTLLGPCRHSVSGNWITSDMFGRAKFSLADVGDVAHIGNILEDIVRRLDLDDTCAGVQPRSVTRPVASTTVREHEVPAQGESIHLGARRNHRNLRKGR